MRSELWQDDEDWSRIGGRGFTCPERSRGDPAASVRFLQGF